jgi:hypothetical protein
VAGHSEMWLEELESISLSPLFDPWSIESGPENIRWCGSPLLDDLPDPEDDGA